MQKARRHPINRAPTACRRMVSGTISLPSSGCFSPFPHGTRSCTIGLTGVFSLAGWSRRIRAGFLVSRVTQDTTRPRLCSCTGLSPSVMQLSRCFHSTFKCRDVVLQPRGCIATAPVWALPRSLATTGGIIFYFLFLEVLRCFSSLRSPPYIHRDSRPSDGWVVPSLYT